MQQSVHERATVVRHFPGVSQLPAEQAAAGRKDVGQLVAATSDLMRIDAYTRTLADAVGSLNHMSLPDAVNSFRRTTLGLQRDLPGLQDVANQLSRTRSPRWR
ncbi:hypothetical protein [Streptomyces tubercidicus]|uniref:hypothetical protein n=1 Tax=Streptomyces tubercidicus TaxID=47759 RepID=UPI003795BE0C